MPAARKARRLFTIYVNSDEANLSQDDFPSVAEACCYASTLTNAHFVISGHTDTVSSDTYNGGLAWRWAAATAEAIKNDPCFREALSVIEHGAMMLAVATDDEVSEPKNRCVEITFLEGA
ncbi:MAG: OmpA family protein [Geminicoccales bacterium]